MRELKATKINAADFAPFGTFFSMTDQKAIHYRVKYINFIQTVFPVPVWDPLVFHLLQYIKMNASLKLLNITQLPGKELLHWMMT